MIGYDSADNAAVTVTLIAGAGTVRVSRIHCGFEAAPLTGPRTVALKVDGVIVYEMPLALVAGPAPLDLGNETLRPESSGVEVELSASGTAGNVGHLAVIWS